MWSPVPRTTPSTDYESDETLTTPLRPVVSVYFPACSKVLGIRTDEHSPVRGEKHYDTYV